MGISPSENVPTATVVAYDKAMEDYDDCLCRQAEINRKIGGSSILTDEDVRSAHAYLLKPNRPQWWALLVSHAAELGGGGLATFGWHWGEAHAKDDFACVVMIGGGVTLFALGVLIREVFARKRQ